MQKGVPDRIIIAPNGSILFLELKAPKKQPTELQNYVLQTLANHNCNAVWCDDFKLAKIAIDLLLDNKRVPCTNPRKKESSVTLSDFRTRAILGDY